MRVGGQRSGLRQGLCVSGRIRLPVRNHDVPVEFLQGMLHLGSKQNRSAAAAESGRFWFCVEPAGSDLVQQGDGGLQDLLPLTELRLVELPLEVQNLGPLARRLGQRTDGTTATSHNGSEVLIQSTNSPPKGHNSPDLLMKDLRQAKLG